jgi:trimethylamine:corrinoid methyltransferase-like protein
LQTGVKVGFTTDHRDARRHAGLDCRAKGRDVAVISVQSFMLGDDLMEIASDTPRRRGRDAQSRDRVAAALIPQAGWGAPRHVSDPMRIVPEDALGRIHDTSLTIQEEIGMDFLSPEAREIAVAAGAKRGPEPERLRFDQGAGDGARRQSPAQFHPTRGKSNTRSGHRTEVHALRFCVLGPAGQ